MAWNYLENYIIKSPDGEKYQIAKWLDNGLKAILENLNDKSKKIVWISTLFGYGYDFIAKDVYGIPLNDTEKLSPDEAKAKIIALKREIAELASSENNEKEFKLDTKQRCFKMRKTLDTIEALLEVYHEDTVEDKLALMREENECDKS